MKVIKTGCNFEREPLKAPFGFKGGYLSELWQTTVCMHSASGYQATGLGTQSTLWSDASVFTRHSESAGNAMMFLMTAYALKSANEVQWENPFQLLDTILPKVHEYGKCITRNPDLRLTFALNALVAVDNAAWLLYSREHHIDSFDAMIPAEFRPALSCRHAQLANIPLMSYNVPLEDIVKAVHDGYFFLKIKIGSDPDKDGNLDTMLEWDKNRIRQIHEVVKDLRTPYTEHGHIPYYFDANGRYDTPERLMKLLTYCDSIGALERIILLEEPFPEDYKEDVSDIPVRLAADESAHSDKDALERIALGYTAVALKPIAKTMSMSLKIATLCHEKQIPCFCADLTVNPILADWNKNVAARLPVLPGMKIGVCESNGHQNYINWEQMKARHPMAGASWITPRNGIFDLDDEFYKHSGGIFCP